MTSPNINYWIYAEINLKRKTDGATKTLKISNREVLGDTTRSYFPLLRSVGRLGAEHDRLGPTSFSGSIQILDSIGSFGAERKFSDVLQRYTIHDQSLSIYVASSSIETTSPSWTLAFKGDVVNWQRDINDSEPIISISVQARLFDRRVIAKEITLGKFPTAPVRSIGKYLPIVFGQSIEVPAVQIDADGVSSPAFAYASTLGTTFKNGGVQNYYAKDLENKYKEVKSAATTTTKLFDKLTGTLVTVVTGNDEDSRTRDLNVDSSTTHILTQAEVVWTQGGAGQTGSLILEIWEKDLNGIPLRKVGQSVRDKADFTWGAGNVTVEHIFERPVLLTSSNGYIAYITQTTKSGTNGHPAYISGASTAVSYTIDQSQATATRNGWTKHVFNQRDFASAFYGVVFTDTPTPISGDIDNNGLGHSYFELTQKTGIGAIPNPDLTALDFIVAIDGLKDDSTGSISGTNNLQIRNANYALELISRTWSGSAWNASNDWDWSDPYGTDSYLTSGFLVRYFEGATVGKVTLEDFARNLCDNSASKVVLRNDGKLAFYSWGKNHNATSTIDQDRGNVTNHEALDPSYVINNIKFGYGRNLKNFNPLNQASQGVPQDYQYILDWYSGINTQYTNLVGQSETLFGKRFLQRNAFDCIKDTTTAENIATFFLSQFNTPTEIITLELPFFENYTLQAQNVINVELPSLPAYYGSSASSRAPDFNGIPTDIAGGYGWFRAELYRAQIESRYIDFGGGDYPKLILNCRLLINTCDPT